MISQKTNAPILLMVPIPNRRLIATRAWDRMQIPLPGSRIDSHFADPIFPIEGEKLENFRKRIEAELRRLEENHDPREAAHNPPVVVQSDRDGESLPPETSDADPFDENGSIVDHPLSAIPTQAPVAQRTSPPGGLTAGDAQFSRHVA
jgi:hypothetical protein